MAESSRFVEISLKTDRQVARLIDHELDFSIRAVSHALITADGLPNVGDYGHKARKVYRDVAHLIPLVGEIHADERRKLESKRDHLRDMLEGLSLLGSTPKVENVPTLARALWKARDCPEGSPEEDWFRAERVLKSLSVSVES